MANVVVPTSDKGAIHKVSDTVWRVESQMFANVMDYGATGDGSTDDTAAINSAISALKTAATGPGSSNWDHAQPGATLYFPPAPGGSYRTTGSHIIDTDLMAFCICGDSAARLICTNKANEIFNIRTISGGPAYPQNLQRGAVIKGMFLGYSESLTSSDTNAIAIKIDDVNGGPVHGLNIHDCYFNNVGSAVSSAGSEGANITMLRMSHCWIQNYKLDGVKIGNENAIPANQENGTGTNCEFYNLFFQGDVSSGYYAIYIFQKQSPIIQGCSFETGGTSDNAPTIYLGECAVAYVIGNRFERGTYHNGDRIIEMAGTSNGHLNLIGLELVNHDIAASADVYIVYNGWTGTANVMGTILIDSVNWGTGSSIIAAYSHPSGSPMKWDALINKQRDEAGTPVVYGHASNANNIQYTAAKDVVFTANNIAGTVGATAMTLCGSEGTRFPVPMNAQVVKVAAYYSGNKTSGTVTIRLIADGTAVTSDTISLANGNGAVTRQAWAYYADENCGTDNRVTSTIGVDYSTSSLSTSGGDLVVTVSYILADFT